MIRNFRRDERGNYAVLTALVMVPVMGALALAVDYTRMSAHRQAALNALDAANIAAARRLLAGDSEDDVLAYARKYFEANLGPVRPEAATLHVELPTDKAGGGTLKMSADLDYQPIFFPVFQALRGEDAESQTKLTLNANNAVRLKNTLEVALVLDNSGSMDEWGSGSGKKRLALLKDAAKQLVETLAKQGESMQQVTKPVQFGVVPFAASVNVGPDKRGAWWMDTDGRSPIHHENFDWETMKEQHGSNKRVEWIDGVYKKRGKDWRDEEEDEIVTRFTLYDELKKLKHNADQFHWAGCVEMRPHPLGLDDTPPDRDHPETLFVPMFAPDETDPSDRGRRAYNDWWADQTGGEWPNKSLSRQRYMPKYFHAVGTAAVPPGKGPNLSCTTEPITPLTDVTDQAGLDLVKGAIDKMRADGATNVPEGMAWGWRVVSGGEPFTEGRPDQEKGNDKVVIVLTDGANTYYTPGWFGASDEAGNKSIYSNYGYAENGRIFDGTTVNSNYYSEENFTKAMNQQFDQLCETAKQEGIMVMTVALDLGTWRNNEREQIDALRRCSSESRFRKDPENPEKPAKLFWNATGAELEETFREIADELSNLRFVS
ncbi:pilus assembly protein TadG-related protein [Nitratireductor sp. GCM10026969]|uniref:pilus assembly protein TadG-related protein n=1 Tax=Nitratireductor sp. GCM10026969 TaxID=3252645 RepID=UPI00361A967E